MMRIDWQLKVGSRDQGKKNQARLFWLEIGRLFLVCKKSEYPCSMTMQQLAAACKNQFGGGAGPSGGGFGGTPGH